MGNSIGHQLYSRYLEHIKEYKINVEPQISEPFFLKQSRFLNDPKDKRLIEIHQSPYSYTMKDVGEEKEVNFSSLSDAMFYAMYDVKYQKKREKYLDFIFTRYPSIPKNSSVQEVETIIKDHKEYAFSWFEYMESILKDDFKRMNELIIDSPPLDQEYIVFRGLQFTERGRKASSLTKAFSKVKIGETMRIETYFSISFDRGTSEDYSGQHCCLLIIRLKKGSHCLLFFASPHADVGSIYLLEGLVESCTLRLDEIKEKSRLEYHFTQL
jgi:hypothetical protein